MTRTSEPLKKPEILYPDSDGEPMAENTEQFNWIVRIKEGLEWLFADQENVFVAGDLFWYPVEGDNRTRFAPDAMVVFGRPKGRRGSYMQWVEDNITPQVVFEVLSPGNRAGEMSKKWRFYQQFGVEEYYLIDPDRMKMQGWLRQNDALIRIAQMDNWISPRLQIKFATVADEIKLYRPDGKLFEGYQELAQRESQMRQQAEQARQRAEKLAEKLRALGIDPDQI